PMFAVLRAGAVSFDRILAPLLGLEVTPVGNYIVLDRHAIEGLSAIDAFNCDYCAYANGISMLLHARLDQLESRTESTSLWRRWAAGATSALTFAAVWPWQRSFVRFFYGVLISRPLGMHRLPDAEADERIERAGYAKGLRGLARRMLRAQKRFAIQLEDAL